MKEQKKCKTTHNPTASGSSFATLPTVMNFTIDFRPIVNKTPTMLRRLSPKDLLESIQAMLTTLEATVFRMYSRQETTLEAVQEMAMRFSKTNQLVSTLVEDNIPGSRADETEVPVWNFTIPVSDDSSSYSIWQLMSALSETLKANRPRSVWIDTQHMLTYNELDPPSCIKMRNLLFQSELEPVKLIQEMARILIPEEIARGATLPDRDDTGRYTRRFGLNMSPTVRI